MFVYSQDTYRKKRNFFKCLAVILMFVVFYFMWDSKWIPASLVTFLVMYCNLKADMARIEQKTDYILSRTDTNSY